MLSGGYVDDEDNGMSFWYTGEGGQEKGKQVGGGCVGLQRLLSRVSVFGVMQSTLLCCVAGL